LVPLAISRRADVADGARRARHQARLGGVFPKTGRISSRVKARVTEIHERNKMRPHVAVAVAAAATLAVLAFAAAALAGSQATHPKLLGVVGKNDAFKITLASKGKVAKILKAGTYTVVIQDDSTIHNYELDGPNGKSWTFTSVGFTGTKTVTLKLVKGKYKAYCAPHESVMFQRFTVI
jgi:hypothetical protein